MAEDLVSLGKRLPILSGKENYTQWKTSMEDILTYSDLWAYVQTGYTLPTDATQKATAEKAQRKALTLIRLQVSPFVHTLVVDSQTPEAAWKILKREFEVTGATSRIFLRRELYTTRMAEDDNLDMHVQKMRTIYNNLRIAGDNVQDSEFVMALLISLPTSWDSFTSTIELKDLDSTDTAVKSATADYILNRIKGEANRRQSHNTEPSNSAFNSKSDQPNKVKQKPDRSNSKCRYCHKHGHWAKECRKRIADEKKKNSANVSSQEQEPSFSFVASANPAVLAGS